MLNYYILWTKDAIISGATYVPLLFPNSKTITQYVAMEYSDIDLARGLAHELWKPDEILEAPKESLLESYSKIVAEVFHDTLEDSFIGISEECREEFGYVCSMHQLLSGWNIVPDSMGIKKNLLADIVNVIQDGLMSDLKPVAQTQVMSVLRDLSLFIPLTTFVTNPRTGLFVAQLFIISYCYASERPVARIVAKEAIQIFSPQADDAQYLLDLTDIENPIEVLTRINRR